MTTCTLLGPRPRLALIPASHAGAHSTDHVAAGARYPETAVPVRRRCASSWRAARRAAACTASRPRWWRAWPATGRRWRPLRRTRCWSWRPSCAARPGRRSRCAMLAVPQKLLCSYLTGQPICARRAATERETRQQCGCPAPACALPGDSAPCFSAADCDALSVKLQMPGRVAALGCRSAEAGGAAPGGRATRWRGARAPAVGSSPGSPPPCQSHRACPGTFLSDKVQTWPAAHT